MLTRSSSFLFEAYKLFWNSSRIVESTWVYNFTQVAGEVDLGVRLRPLWKALNSLSLKVHLKSMLESTSVCDLTQVACRSRLRGATWLLKTFCLQNAAWSRWWGRLRCATSLKSMLESTWVCDFTSEIAPSWLLSRLDLETWLKSIMESTWVATWHLELSDFWIFILQNTQTLVSTFEYSNLVCLIIKTSVFFMLLEFGIEFTTIFPFLMIDKTKFEFTFQKSQVLITNMFAIHLRQLTFIPRCVAFN